MKEISSKLKNQARDQIRNVDILNSNYERVTLNGIMFLFGVLAFLYVLILGNMVSDIVARRSLEQSARSLSSEVSSLELTYLSMSNSVDLNLSRSLGFKETKATFATRKAIGSLSSLDNGI